MADFWREFLAEETGAFDLGVLQMMVRAVLVYLIAITVVRLGSKRFMGRNSAFDLILGIILGSVLSRGITGQSPFWPTMAAGAVLMTMHAALAMLAYYWTAFGPWVKGQPRLLVKDGAVLNENMRRSRLGNHDLDEALRNAGLTSSEQVKLAHLERDGNISVVRRDKEPRVLEVKVEAGVQRVRIELG